MNTSTAYPWRRTAQGVIVRVHVQPRAAHNRFVGLHGGALKIALTAPPIENAANRALLSFLAVLLRIPRSSLSLLSGVKSREKHVLIATKTSTAMIQLLEQLFLPVDKKILDG